MLTQRPYHSRADLYETGKLVRRAYAVQPNWNTYSFARFDIWMQRRSADEALYHKSDWQQDFQFWENDGDLIGAVFFESPSDAMLIGHPAHPDLIDLMLDWAEAHYRAKNSDQPLMIEAMESNVAHCDRLKARGYTLYPGYFIQRHKSLDRNIVEPVNLPPGYSIKPIETDEERRLYPSAVQSVFNRSTTVEQDEFLKRAPSYTPELHLLVWSDQHEIAAFCTVWIDPVNHYAEFEPVGTVPRFQKRGLGSALLAYAHNRLRELGCPLATVNSWSPSEGANKLYQAAGLLPKDRQLNWIESSNWQGT
ncbi:MAG TPA: GNAT family N-acetyltransferase [Anaerolineae bacterium]|nr:GNAT family N-acetyltransferase [Anaerolineae bacterium]